MSRFNKVLRFTRLMLTPRGLRALVSLSSSGYLEDSGWWSSLVFRRISNRGGDPIPWASLPFVDFLLPRLTRDLTIFEYGSGASSLCYAARVKRVAAVEHDQSFAQQLAVNCPPNLTLVVRPLGPEYVKATDSITSKPDIISVDGRMRVECLRHAVTRIAPAGVIILDDSERPEYAEGIELMTSSGFRSLEFWGLAVGRTERKCTRLFYRPENCLGI